MMIKSILLEKEVGRHAYLYVNEDTSILIDPGAIVHADKLMKGIRDSIEIKDIHYIILQSNDYLNITSIPLLINEGFKGTIICHEEGVKYIESAINYKVTTIDMINYQLMLKDMAFYFIPTPFLPYSEGFVTYEKNQRALFSAHLFSQHRLSNDETLSQVVNRFHEETLPSIEFIRQAIRKIRKYPMFVIYPRLGKPIRSSQMNDLISSVMNYDFYHSTQVVERKNQKNMTYNYEMICNHMLKRLASIYHRNDILSVFSDSEIALILTPDVEIENTELTGYKLWNYFFDRIYEKKGITWLVILEPVVKKYHTQYHIQKPVIYKSNVYQQQLQIDKLNEQTDELTEKVKALENEINETSDKLLRNTLTNLYNERFMKQFIENDLNKDLNSPKQRALALIVIDQIIKINQTYGKEVGDETIHHLAYLLHNLKCESSQLFKQNGPGIFVYLQDMSKREITEQMLRLRNAIHASEVFIEPITVSIAVARFDENNRYQSSSDRLEDMMALVLKRMAFAKSKGTAHVIDEDSKDIKLVDGHILLIDEDETYQNMMVKIFERIHYQVIVMKDIYEAYEMLKTMSIDLIISEINMSKLDGFQFKHILNQTKDFKDIPFVIVSHHKDLDVVVRANELSIDLILQKPIIPEELIGHIKRIREKWMTK